VSCEKELRDSYNENRRMELERELGVPELRAALQAEKLRADRADALLEAFKEALVLMGGAEMKASIPAAERVAAGLLARGY
jgi:truncated hemoglobin YjbI